MGSLTRGRVVCSEHLGAAKSVASAAPEPRRRRVVPREEIDARAKAAAIVGAATVAAASMLERARAGAAEVAAKAHGEAVEQEHAKLAAAWLALRAREEGRAALDLDRATTLAAVLAERLVGRALVADPTTIALLAKSALAEARGARRATILAHPSDAAVLVQHLGSAGLPEGTVDVVADDTLTPGSLVVQTELGTVDARLRPQLERLAAALREALGG